MKKLLLCFILINSLISVFAQYPTVNNDRPRIWVDSSRFALLQDLISVPGEAQDTYNEIVYAYDNWWITDPQLYLVGSDSTIWTWDWTSSYADTQSLLTVFLFKMTNDELALKRCRFIARQVINQIDTIDFSSIDWYEKESLLRKLSDNDMLLDQCYDYFPAGLRDSLTQSLYIMNREFMNTYILSDYGNSYVSSHNTWNNIYCNQNALTLYNSAGLTEEQRDTVRQWYETIYDKHINGFIPCWTYFRDDDGGWNWGAAYSMWSLVDQFQLFENMRIGTNKDFYTDLPWVQNSINQYIYFIQPDDKCIHLGDGQTKLAADRVVYLHSRYYNDPRSQWMAQKYSHPSITTWTTIRFQKLLYKDFSMPVVEQPNLPLDWWSDKVGLSVSRSSWDSTATMVTFFNSPSKRAAHEHRDNNSFTIFKNSPLLIDAGHYDFYASSHYLNYYQRTIAHNSICVYDSTENYSNFGQEASNDGGQIESFHLKNYNDIFLPQNQRGEWKLFASGDTYTYNIADAQLSYDSTKLDFFRRRLLYIKPNKVIVLDHINLKNIDTHQRDIKWIGHFVNKPIISGDIVNTLVPDHIETYNGNTYRATNGEGSIALKTILPTNSTTTLIGGSGYEYWVDGTNYNTITSPDTSFYSPGSWRIEVRPTEITDSVIYLHTIDIGDSDNVATAGGIALENNTSVGVDWNDTIYFFSKDAEINKDYHIFSNISGNRTIGIFASDLSENTYYIKIDGTITETIPTDENGIIQTSLSLSAGNHTIEITLNNQTSNSLKTNNPINIFPNPANKELYISLPPSSKDFEINIINIKGQLVMSTFNKSLIDISSLSSGQYFIQIKQDNKSFYARFIKE